MPLKMHISLADADSPNPSVSPVSFWNLHAQLMPVPVAISMGGSKLAGVGPSQSGDSKIMRPSLVEEVKSSAWRCMWLTATSSLMSEVSVQDLLAVLRPGG